MSHVPVFAGEQIFISYGPRTAAQRLQLYAFFDTGDDAYALPLAPGRLQALLRNGTSALPRLPAESIAADDLTEVRRSQYAAKH
jgi:hypothetical protein